MRRDAYQAAGRYVVDHSDAILAIWDGVWKLIALWKSARNDQLAWFICLAIFNTVGILPILYILLFQKSPQTAPPQSR